MASITVTGKTGDFLIGRDSHYTMKCLFEENKAMAQDSFGQDVSQLMTALNTVEDFHGIDRTTWHEGPDGKLGDPEESTHPHMVVNIGGDIENVGHLRDAVDRLRVAGGVDPWAWRTVPALDEEFNSYRNAVSALHLLEIRMAIGRILTTTEWSIGELKFSQGFSANPASEPTKTVSFSGWTPVTSNSDSRRTEEEILKTNPLFRVGITFRTIGRIERLKVYGRTLFDDEDDFAPTPFSIPTTEILEVSSNFFVQTPGVQVFEADPIFPNFVNSTDPGAYKRADLSIYILRNDTPGGTNALEPFEEKFVEYWNIQGRSEPSVGVTPFVGIPLASVLNTEYYSEIQGAGVTEARFAQYRAAGFLGGQGGLEAQAQQIGGDFCNDYTIQTFSEDQVQVPGKPDSLILTDFRGVPGGIAIFYPLFLVPGSEETGAFIPFRVYTRAEASTIGYLTGNSGGETQSIRGACWPPDKVDPATDCPPIAYAAQPLQAPDDIDNYDWQGLSSDPLLGKDPATIGDDPGDHDELYEFIATHGGIFDPTEVPHTSWRKYLFMFPTQLDKIDYMETLNPGPRLGNFSWMPSSISGKFQFFLGKGISPPTVMEGFEYEVRRSVFVRAESRGSMTHRIHADISLPSLDSGQDEWLYWKKDDGAAGSPFEEVVRRVS